MTPSPLAAAARSALIGSQHRRRATPPTSARAVRRRKVLVWAARLGHAGRRARRLGVARPRRDHRPVLLRSMPSESSPSLDDWVRARHRLRLASGSRSGRPSRRPCSASSSAWWPASSSASCSASSASSPMSSSPYIKIANAIPRIVLAPIFTVAFGLGIAVQGGPGRGPGVLRGVLQRLPGRPRGRPQPGRQCPHPGCLPRRHHPPRGDSLGADLDLRQPARQLRASRSSARSSASSSAPSGA